MKREKYSEAAIARVVIEELQLRGYETYEEVSTGYGSKRADIVAVHGPVVMIVETKVAFSVDLMSQLVEWYNAAHYVIGAAPNNCQSMFQDYARIKGIGLWRVIPDTRESMYSTRISEMVAPRMMRAALTYHIKRCLSPEQKTGGEFAKAGTNGGNHWSPFRSTVRNLIAVVHATPGITMKEAVRQTQHHYSSASSAVSVLPRLIRQGVIPEISIEETRPLKLWPANHEHIRALKVAS